MQDIQFDGVEVIGAVKPIHCKRICRTLDTCAGFDYDTNKNECYAYVSPNKEFSLTQAPGTDNYILSKRCSHGGITEFKIIVLL